MIPGLEQATFDSLLFPGRKTLYVSEVAERLSVTEQHIIDLIDEGLLLAINIGCGQQRKHYRIPVECYERFLKSRASV